MATMTKEFEQGSVEVTAREKIYECWVRIRNLDTAIAVWRAVLLKPEVPNTTKVNLPTHQQIRARLWLFEWEREVLINKIQELEA